MTFAKELIDGLVELSTGLPAQTVATHEHPGGGCDRYDPVDDHHQGGSMMTAGRVLHVSLDLLDRQLLDRAGVECGKIDDLELTRSDEGVLYVSAMLCGPGVLWYRLGRRKMGRWIQRAHHRSGFVDEDDRTRIGMHRASDIGASVRVAADRADLASTAVEHWTLDHFIGHIPGHDHDVDD